MTRSRDEVNADMAPHRIAMIQVGEHLMDEHGVAAHNPTSTTPKGMESDAMRIAWLGHYIPDEGWPMQVGEGLEITKAVRAEIDAAIVERQNASCSLEICPGVERLLELYKGEKAVRNALRKELPEPVGGGPAITIRPHGLKVEVLTGLLES